MKRIVIFLFFHFLYYSCKSQSNYKTEEQLYQCLISKFKSQNVDLIFELDSFERYLVSNGILTGSSGQAYIEFYKVIENTNKVPCQMDYSLFDNFNKVKFSDYFSADCFEKLGKPDSSEFLNSKYYLLSIKMKETSTDPEKSLSKIAKGILSVLSIQDFETPFYRARNLLIIAHTCDPLRLKIIEPPKLDYSKMNSMSIYINSNNELLLNENIIDTNELKIVLKTFILENKANHVLYFSMDNDVLLQSYIDILELINQVYNLLKNEKSMEIYNTYFTNLNDENKKTIKEIYPNRIIIK